VAIKRAAWPVANFQPFNSFVLPFFFQNESVLTFAIEARGPGERQHIDLRFILIFLPKGIG
jgi:hypothetical protein